MIKGRMTTKKAQILAMFTCGDVSSVGGYPLTARDVLVMLGEQATIDQIRAMRRTLETLVRDGYLVHDVSESYLEVSTGRTIKRKGVAYDLPEEQRSNRSGGVVETFTAHETAGSLECFDI